MIAKGDQRPAADSIHKIFAKVQHKEPCSKKNVLILTNRTDIGHNHLVENPHSKENRLLSGNNSRFRNIGEANCPTNEVLQPSPIMVAVIISVAYNHMVEEVDSHKVASLFEGLGQSIVKLARMNISARVVVDEGQYRGIIQNCLLDNHPHVPAHLSQTTLAALPSRWKMLVIHDGLEAQGKADCEYLAEKPTIFPIFIFEKSAKIRFFLPFSLIFKEEIDSISI